MTVVNQNIEVYRGDTAQVSVVMTNADGTPYDTSIPGITMEWRMSTSWHGDTLVRKLLPGEITASAGIVTFTLLSTETDLKPRLYYHELKVHDGVAANDVSMAMTGTVILRKSRLGSGETVIALMASTPPTVKVAHP